MVAEYLSDMFQGRFDFSIQSTDDELSGKRNIYVVDLDGRCSCHYDMEAGIKLVSRRWDAGSKKNPQRRASGCRTGAHLAIGRSFGAVP